jgi:hypothetical protein
MSDSTTDGDRDDANHDGGPRDWLGARGASILGTLANELLGNSTVNGALSRAFEARGRATEAQQAAMAFLNIPSAGDLERLTRRVRALSQRLEAIEDALARIEEDLRRDLSPIARRLESLDGDLSTATKLIHELHHARVHVPSPPAHDQASTSA